MQPAPVSNDADRATLWRLNDEYIRAVAVSDAAWFQANLAADFLNSNPDGTLADRAAFIGQVAAPCAVADFRAEEVLIRMLGDVAIVHGRTRYRKAGGEAASGRYTDIWVRRQERWLCAAAHVTRG